MKTKTFYLTDRQIERLEALVKETGMAMAEHMRRAIDDYLKNVKNDSHMLLCPGCHEEIHRECV